MLEKITFKQKLHIISEIYFETHKQSLFEDELVRIENNLKLKMPEELKEFYIMFGDDLDLLKCMYNIVSPKELNVENNILIIAKENQNVCGYGVNTITKKLVYVDTDNNIIKEINQGFDDFLIYLLAVQGTEYLDCIGTIDVGSIAEIEKHLTKLTESNERAVFCDRDSIIAVVVRDSIFICAKNDDCMEIFENKTCLEVDYL